MNSTGHLEGSYGILPNPNRTTEHFFSSACSVIRFASIFLSHSLSLSLSFTGKGIVIVAVQLTEKVVDTSTKRRYHMQREYRYTDLLERICQTECTAGTIDRENDARLFTGVQYIQVVYRILSNINCIYLF